MVENDGVITASVTTEGTFTVTSRTFTPAGGAGPQQITVTKTNNSVSADITEEMQVTGGEINIGVVCDQDNTKTATITYSVAKVYSIGIAGNLTQNGNVVTATIATNNTTFTPSATLNNHNLADSVFSISGNTLTIDLSDHIYNDGDELEVTVICNTDPSKSDTKRLILAVPTESVEPELGTDEQLPNIGVIENDQPDTVGGVRSITLNDLTQNGNNVLGSVNITSTTEGMAQDRSYDLAATFDDNPIDSSLITKDDLNFSIDVSNLTSGGVLSVTAIIYNNGAATNSAPKTITLV